MTAEMKDITGIKRVADKLYVIINNGERQVVDSSFSDKRGTVVGYKTVSDFSLVEITQEQCKQYIDIAREQGALPPELPSQGQEIWTVNFTATINELEIIQAENIRLREENAELLKEVVDLQVNMVEPADHLALMDAHNDTVEYMRGEIARIQSDFGQRLVEQAADYEAKIADLNKSLSFWRDEGIRMSQEGDIF